MSTITPSSRLQIEAAEEFPHDHRRPRMEGRVVFVTGGTRGIGAAISRSFAEQGAIVAAGYGRDAAHAERLVTQLREHGVDASSHQGNVGSSEDCRRTIAEVITTHGRLDVLVNNAGITIDKTALKMTDEDWYKVIAVNLSGAFFMSQAVLPHMIERGSGRIISISSIIGEIGSIGAGELRRVEIRFVRADEVTGARSVFRAASCRHARGGLDRHHSQRCRARIHRYRDARAHPREGARADQGADPRRPARPA
jgi:NAD(P)-dependent dehydrogenase (short-subunit alcohol dehydrogenase family)